MGEEFDHLTHDELNQLAEDNEVEGFKISSNKEEKIAALQDAGVVLPGAEEESAEESGDDIQAAAQEAIEKDEPLHGASEEWQEAQQAGVFGGTEPDERLTVAGVTGDQEEEPEEEEEA